VLGMTGAKEVRIESVEDLKRIIDIVLNFR
jgi:hypothetical protein